MNIRVVKEIPSKINLKTVDHILDDTNLITQARILKSLALNFKSEIFLKLRYGLPHVKLDNMSRIWRFRTGASYAALEFSTDELTAEKDILLWLDYEKTSLEDRQLTYSHFINMFTDHMRKIKRPRFVRNTYADRKRLAARLR